jgi:uncharacterized protein YkwD
VVSLAGFERDLYLSHLVVRGQNHVGGLEVDATLTAIARERAADMAARAYFSHYAPYDASGRATVFNLLAAVGYSYAIAGENIARNNLADGESVQAAMNRFLSSAGHRNTMLDARYGRVGVGSATDGRGMKYFAVVFTN